MSLKSSKQASNRVKLIVFGYIREHESSELIIIPSLISYTCLTYCFVHEYFAKALEDYFKISNDKMMVTNIKGKIGVGFHTIYCNQWINTSSNIIAKWTFFIKSCDGNTDGMFFGLASKDKRIDKDFCGKDNGPCYQISSLEYKFSHGYFPGIYIGKAFYWKSNDTITFILDLTNIMGTLSIKINDKQQMVIFHDIEKGNDIKYKMAVQLCDKNDCVILKEYEESYV
eukprot:301256_1